MKKILASILCAALLLSLTLPALAETEFSFSTSATEGYPAWCEAAESNGKNWHFTWGAGTNIASDCRAVVRILTEEGNYASSLWVYSTRSTAYHPYNSSAAYGNAHTMPAGRLDNRDTGTLVVNGTFWN